jgi:Tfp pilus assembly protein PilF
MMNHKKNACTKHRRHRTGVALILAAALGGCASAPANRAEPFLGLYDGNSQTLYEAGQAVESPEQAHALAEEALRRGDTDFALYLHIKALELGGQAPGPLVWIGTIHRSRGNLALAEAAYQWALRLDEAHAAANEGLGLALLHRRAYEAAAVHLARAVEADDSLWEAHNGLGVLADIRQDFAEAAPHYDRAIEIRPQAPMLYNNLGYSRYLAGDWDAAQRQFERALSIDPHYDQARLNLGLLHVRKGHYERAVNAFRRVMGPAQAYNQVGYVCMGEGKLVEAEHFFLKAIKTSPTYYAKANENLERVRSLARVKD